ncbi:gliding motility-associated C-terminal domain-containing protein [Chryseobacterium taichungense]|uniref:Gliding motility-associated C-terminal domain-containing protein n=1 Tax=Chryseobacterium taichungense TaxID=295069 RepID=A0A1H8C169_9FLAO|nr:T9SS type B sorting domain-containing protein [Chryseobacterium taichungense]SEM88810.1 gliding motility-associated C-terminal domain-containing protein [Chryseobacterium taichungense]
MRKILFLLTFFSCISIFSQKKTPANNDYFFYENKGQIVDQDGKENSSVKYLFLSNGLNVQLKQNGFSYDVYEVKKTVNPNSSKFKKDKSLEGKTYYEDEFLYENLYHRIDIELLNSNKNASIIAEGKSLDYNNYFNIPNQPKGVTNVHRFKKVLYKNIYPNIDLVFFKPNDTLKPVEYNFIINPGGRISDIKMKFNGAPTVIKDHKLSMKVRFGEMYENIPNSWIAGNKKENIDVAFKDLGDQTFGFNAPINTSNKTIVIDPVPTRVWGSYAGGFGDDYGRIKTDIQNTGYLYGTTNSNNNFATSGTYQQNIVGNLDCFIIKLTKQGQRLWGTYYGFGNNDVFEDLDFDENFNIYAGGTIERGPLNNNIAVVKFNNNGGLIYLKEFVTNSRDKLYSISYNQNEVFIGGDTFSFDFPTVNAMQNTKASPSGYTDGILASLDAATGNVNWATYFGQSDGSTSIFQIISSTTNLEMIGATQSSTIPMVNAFQAVKAGGVDGIYVKLSKTGNTIIKSSYYGNTGHEFIIKGGIINNVLVLPGKYSTAAFPLGQPGIWRVNLANNTITKNYFNFDGDPQLLGYPDSTGNVFFTGLHSSGQPDISTPGAYMGFPGLMTSTFLIKYNQNDIKEWGTYYRGNGATQLGEVIKDNEGAIYLTGMSSGNTSGIATPGTFQQSPGGGNDIFIAKFQDCTSASMVTSNSPVCINSTLQLNASGGTSYNWTGPNGFTSTLQNPTIANATASHSGVYSCQVSGSGSCDGIFTVNVIVGDNIAPIPNTATLADITGDCHTVISTIPTATDNCAGTITATTTDPLSYSIPGTYVIHWTYNDGNGNISTQNQNVTVTSPALPITTSVQQTFCASSHPTIANLQITGQNIKWYDAAGNILPSTTTLVNGQTYYASQTINGCESNKTAVQVTINETPEPAGNSVQDFCASSNPTLASLIVSGTAIKFYDAAGNILPLTTPLIHGVTYFVTQTLNNCESEKLPISVTLSTNNVPANDFSATVCNSSTGNSTVIDLTSYQANLITNPGIYTFTYNDNLGSPIANPSNYTMNVGSTVIHVKVSTTDGCFIVVRLSLTINPKPNLNLPEKIDFCKGKNTTLDAGNGYSSYLWSTGATTQTITVSTPGNYSVTVTNSFGCQNTDHVEVSYTILPEITAVNINNNSATIILSATGNFEYSLDNITWQDSNIFTNLNIGEYIVYVRTKEGCIIGQKPFSIFNIPNAFTPNGDGYNDRWKIAGLENYLGTEVNVYDRRGLPVFKEVITKKPLEWDGKLNGSQVPTGNYWYTIKVSDGRVYTGWLMIKNRE